MNQEKNIVWNASNVAFFWSNYVKNPNNHGAWMSEGSGKAIVRRMRKSLPSKFFSSSKVICDWGCGTGAFAKGFATKGHKVYGLDQMEVISEIRNDIANFTCLSNSSQIADGELDLIYALEVIEHIIESEVEKTFSEWRRILNRTGFLLLTTPNNEDLDKNSVICPNCETKFHSVQHVRSLSTHSISKMLEVNGFKVERVWLGEFFFSTKRGFLLETLRKILFVFRKLRESKNDEFKQPHMMVICKLK